MFKLNYHFPAARLLVFISSFVLTVGCAAPHHTISLNQVLEQELIHKRTKPKEFPCTAGAHRGASTIYRENTLAALKAANDDPRYAFIEFDVQYTKDNRIVAFHDQTLMRQYGSLKSIRKTNYDELKVLTKGEMATYDELMDVLTKKLNIEIKSQGDPEQDQRLADEIIADITDRGRREDVMISSISRELVEYINRTDPGIPTGQIYWLTSSTYLHFDRLTEELYEKFNSSQADYLMLHVANLHNIQDLLKLKPKNKTIVFWDFDDKIYIVHKDLSDRLWGESAAVSFIYQARYKLSLPTQNR